MAADRKKENQMQADRQNVGDRMQPETAAALLRQRMIPMGAEQQMVQALRNRMMNADTWQNSPAARALLRPPDAQQSSQSGTAAGQDAMQVLHKDRIGPAEVAKAQTILDKYRAGKADAFPARYSFAVTAGYQCPRRPPPGCPGRPAPPPAYPGRRCGGR